METIRGSEEPCPHPHSGRIPTLSTQATTGCSQGAFFSVLLESRNGANWCFTDAYAVNTQNFLELFRRSSMNTHIRSICPWTCTKQHFQSEIQWLKPVLGSPLKREEEGSRDQIPESHFLVRTLHPVSTLVTSPCLSFLVCKMRVTVITSLTRTLTNRCYI